MAKAFVFLAEGFEDIEALAPVDIMRRGGVDVTTVSITDDYCVCSAHGVVVLADKLFADIDFAAEDPDLLVLPGGMPGAANLHACADLCQLLTDHNGKRRLIGAICAAPAVVLTPLGILNHRRATCYPGFESAFTDTPDNKTVYTADRVTVDANIVTACGPGAAMAFGYELLTQLGAADVAGQLRVGMRYED